MQLDITYYSSLVRRNVVFAYRTRATRGSKLNLRRDSERGRTDRRVYDFRYEKRFPLHSRANDYNLFTKHEKKKIRIYVKNHL